MKLPIEPLTTTAFTPFGRVIERPGRSPDATGPGWQWWGENALMDSDGRGYGIGYLDLRPAPLRFDWAERHMRSVELLVPMGGDCLVYVGPPEHPDEPGRLPSLERFRVFRVAEGQGVLLEKGVWHGAPLALDRPLNVAVLLLHNTGQVDVSVVRFEDVEIERN